MGWRPYCGVKNGVRFAMLTYGTVFGKDELEKALCVFRAFPVL